MSSTVVKGSIVLAGGSRALRRVLLPGFALVPVAGIGVALLI